VPLQPTCDFVLLACDGLWDCFSSEQAITWCHKNIYKGAFGKGKLTNEQLIKGTEAIVDASCAQDILSSQGVGCDNVTAVLVEFLK
jgi:serine/threonine protein phosphatase PrpC